MKTRNFLSFRLPLCFALMMIAGSLIAQQELIKAESGEEQKLQPLQKQTRDGLMSSGLYTSYDFVSVKDIATLQNDGSIDFKIPGDAKNYTAQLDYIDYKDATSYTWAGLIDNEEPGYLMLVQDRYGVAGFVQTSDKFYSILPMGLKHALLLEHSVAPWDALTCGGGLSTGPSNNHTCDAEERSCPAIIDAVLLLSPPARAWIESFNFNFGLFTINLGDLILQVAVHSTNWAFELSGVDDKRLRAQVADILSTP